MLAYDPISSQLLHILMVSLNFGETVPYIKILNKFDPTLFGKFIEYFSLVMNRERLAIWCLICNLNNLSN